MNKLIKFTAAALLSLFVVACGDKADPKADFKAITEWSQANQQSVAAAQQELLTAVESNPAELDKAVANFQGKIAEYKKSLMALKIQSPEIKVLKDKTAAALDLSNELVTEGLKAVKDPASVNQEALAEKTQKALDEVNELQKLSAELKQKYGQ